MPYAANWLLTYLLHSTVLALAALMLMWCLRRPAQRAIAARAGLLTAFATATLATWPVSALPERPVLRVADASESLPVPPTHQTAREGAARKTIAAGRTIPRHWPAGVFTVSVLLSLVVLTRELRGRWAIRGRELLGAGPMGGRVTVSSAVSIPLALGRREVVVPPRFRDLEPAAVAAVLAHEGAHLERRDPLWSGLMELARAVAWFQPLGHVLARLHGTAAEFAADDMAVRRGADAVGLARALQQLASWGGRGGAVPIAAARALKRRPVLVRRVERLLAPSPGQRGRGGVFGLGALSLLAVAMGCAGPQVSGQIAPEADAAPTSGSTDPVIEVTLEPDGTMTMRLPPRPILAAHGRPADKPIAADDGLLGLLMLDVRNFDSTDAQNTADRPRILTLRGGTTLAEVRRLLHRMGAQRFSLTLKLPSGHG